MLGRGRGGGGHAEASCAEQVCLGALRQPVSLSVAASRDFDIEAISWILRFAWALGRPRSGQAEATLWLSGRPEGHVGSWTLSYLPNTRERQRRGHVLLAAPSPAGLMLGAPPRLGSTGWGIDLGSLPSLGDLLQSHCSGSALLWL